ncbi:DUF6268 family outer membrane beta-barrel protein [uncultured Bacteroides sp.]|uniref:DUF6268 family outer membrane beta-barrel protein n=1 Tax=uncultured Bacteroides sp. TaxID=162156 RepID=UPI0026775A61|nr:DUF6268 family outer membrane beta-barrel protein [uncultured Bacteroides sp.]
MRRIQFLMVLVFTAISAYGQGYVEVGHTPSRNFMEDEGGEKLGAGNMWQLKGRYTFPFLVKQNERKQPMVWSGTLNGMFSHMNNNGMAAEVNPNDILNLSFNVSHLRPISSRWYMMASFGIGLYTIPNDISFKSILANGAVIFAYKLRDNLDVGIGAGLTNSYGVPLIMPMGFLKWNMTGLYEVNMEVASSMKASVSRTFSHKFRFTLVPIDMDGMSAVVKRNEKYAIYGATRMRTYISPELKVGSQSCLYVAVGVELLHSVKVSDRSYKGFISSFKGNSSWRFGCAFHVMAGFKYGF